MYKYEKSTGQFRNLKTGRFAPLSDVETAIDTEVFTLQNKLGQHGADYADKRIDLSTFQARMATDIKDSHIRMGAMGAGGHKRLNRRTYGLIGGRLSNEYTQYLYKFGQDLNNKDYSREYIIRRSKLYARSPRQSFHAVRHVTRIQDGAKEAKRVLDPNANHCPECPGYQTFGQWVDASFVFPPGRNCSCRGNCKCTVVYRPKQA